MCNRQSINCLLGKFSPTRKIESGAERHGRCLSAVHQLSLLFSSLKLEWRAQRLTWFEATESACCSISSNFGKLLVYDKLLICLQFFIPVLSLFFCALVVITAYSISQRLVNDISALLNVVVPPAFDEWSPSLVLACGWAEPRVCEFFQLPQCRRQISEARLITKSFWIPPCKLDFLP